MKIDGVGGHQTRIESHEPRSAEAELREQGLRVLARIIAHMVAKESRDDPESPISPASGCEQGVRDKL
jgi:hypothetical protein